MSRVERLEEILGYFTLKSSEISGDLEIQYVVRGFERLKDRAINLLKAASEEVVACIWNEDLFRALRGELRSFAPNGVKLKLALSPRLRRMEYQHEPFLMSLLLFFVLLLVFKRDHHLSTSASESFPSF